MRRAPHPSDNQTYPFKRRTKHQTPIIRALRQLVRNVCHLVLYAPRYRIRNRHAFIPTIHLVFQLLRERLVRFRVPRTLLSTLGGQPGEGGVAVFICRSETCLDGVCAVVQHED